MPEPHAITAQAMRELESYLSFLKDHELDDIYNAQPINRLLAENKSRSVTATAQNVSATVTPLPSAARVNALRPESLRHFDVERAVTAAAAIAASAATVEALYAAVDAFPDVPLRYEGGKGLIRGRGALPADVLIVGDVPDADEDEAQAAFQGKPGHLTDAALSALGLNARTLRLPGLFWRPAGGRPATDEDIRLTSPFLRRLIELSAPKVLILCGATAVRSVLDSNDSVQKLRGKAHHLTLSGGSSLRVFVTFPPALLLRQPLAKKAFWSDFLLATDGLA
ncbi:uracil-DNA glycosylase [Asticcacaulis excentricus]|uniref:Uracil-DNA glycosylase superfamily n=1 Tax=Asticcacaulis excentricus (strain ATCC 15261 / DSM 4724 / KCTC 12464 / NCIMB 9791 / VKM B-1370 / CB 48) TaxID=573065 RepID=E8RTE1_ASTEC|nr:uracil-DNA glycosylase [Asticcacaulis excentricus]ADU14762.1 Uracil-DNA glycosylase superfamily [Asticcacaulis excentricus CB 48]